MAAHSKIGASSYYRWKACPGSVKLSEGIESPESSYAREGTIAHDIAAGMLEDFFFQRGKPDVPPQYAAEDIESIKTYFNTIKKDAKVLGCVPSSGHVLVEHRFDLSSVYPGLFGTGDCVLYSPLENKVVVYDYKHGAGIPVEVTNNLQLQYYGLGALISSGFACEKVELVIIQPRCNHSSGVVRRWEFSSVELLDFAAQLAEDAEATEDENAMVVPGEHCRFCPAAPAKCAAIREQAKEIARQEFEPVNMNAERLSEALNIIPQLEAWIKATREFAYAEAQHGRKPKGYKLVSKRALRKWVENESDIHDKLKEIAPKKEFYKKTLLSPAQVEKLLGKDKGAIEDLWVKESSGYTLVKESDKRPEVVLDASADFKAIPKGE